MHRGSLLRGAMRILSRRPIMKFQQQQQQNPPK
jgi:hypothetical protein